MTAESKKGHAKGVPVEQSEGKPRRGGVVAAYGEESLKVVDGKIQRAIPFVGADRPGEFSSLGIGIMLPDNGNKGQIWGLAVPHMLIQSWRAMKLLESVDVIDISTLSNAWYAGRREPHSSDQRRVDELATQVGEDKFKALREVILDQVPQPEVLQSMLTNLIANEVEVDAWELREEIDSGRLAQSPLINELLAAHERRRQEYKRREEELKQPLPPEQSLAALFHQLGIDNMINGGGFGAYGIDWGHIELDTLEMSIRRNSHYSGGAEPLHRTTQAPRASRTDLAPGMSMILTETGQIESPSVRTEDGIQYTFTEAKFQDGEFTILTISESQDGEPVEAEYTVPQLREILAGLLQPQQSTLRKRLTKIFSRNN